MQEVVRLGSGAPLWGGSVALTAKATSLCAQALLSLPCLSPSSIAYHAICDKTDNQAHVSLSQGRQLLNFPRKYLLMAPLFLGPGPGSLAFPSVPVSSQSPSSGASWPDLVPSPPHPSASPPAPPPKDGAVG